MFTRVGRDLVARRFVVRIVARRIVINPILRGEFRILLEPESADNSRRQSPRLQHRNLGIDLRIRVAVDILHRLIDSDDARGAGLDGNQNIGGIERRRFAHPVKCRPHRCSYCQKQNPLPAPDCSKEATQIHLAVVAHRRQCVVANLSSLVVLDLPTTPDSNFSGHL